MQSIHVRVCTPAWRCICGVDTDAKPIHQRSTIARLSWVTESPNCVTRLEYIPLHTLAGMQEWTRIFLGSPLPAVFDVKLTKRVSCEIHATFSTYCCCPYCVRARLSSRSSLGMSNQLFKILSRTFNQQGYERQVKSLLWALIGFARSQLRRSHSGKHRDHPYTAVQQILYCNESLYSLTSAMLRDSTTTNSSQPCLAHCAVKWLIWHQSRTSDSAYKAVGL